MAGRFTIALVEIDNASRKESSHAAEKLLWYAKTAMVLTGGTTYSDMPAWFFGGLL